MLCYASTDNNVTKHVTSEQTMKMISPLDTIEKRTNDKTQVETGLES